MGQSGTIWDNMGLSRTIWDSRGLSGTIWDQREQVIAIWKLFFFFYFLHTQVVEELALLKTIIVWASCKYVCLLCKKSSLSLHTQLLFHSVVLLIENRLTMFVNGVSGSNFKYRFVLFATSYGHIKCSLLIHNQMEVLNNFYSSSCWIIK